MKLSTPLSRNNGKCKRVPKMFGNNDEYLSRITKTLYYGKFPKSDRTSLPVTELAAEIFSDTKNKISLEYLDTKEAADISCNACVSPCSLVLALLYLDRLKTSNPKYLAKVSPSELFLISLLIGSKFLQDDGEEDEVNNDEWAASAGITVQDINRAEKEFLKAIDWEVYVSQDSFWKQLRMLERKVSLKEGCKRGGWFTYTDLNSLLELMEIMNFIHTVIAVTAVCLASYTAGVLTMAGSTALVGKLNCLKPSNSAGQSDCILYNMFTNSDQNNQSDLTQFDVDKNMSSLDTEINDTPERNDTNYVAQWHVTWTEPNLNSAFLPYDKWPTYLDQTLLNYPYSFLNHFNKDWRTLSEPLNNWADAIKSCLLQQSTQLNIMRCKTGRYGPNLAWRKSGVNF